MSNDKFVDEFSLLDLDAMRKSPQIKISISRSNPIKETLTSLDGYPKKLKIYRIEGSQFWQVRCYLDGKMRTKSTKTSDKFTAIIQAKLFYWELNSSRRFRKIKNSEDNREDIKSFTVLAERVMQNQRVRVIRGELSPMSCRNICYRIREHLMPFFGDQPIGDITHDDIMQFSNSLTERNLGSIAVSQYLQALRSVFSYAYASNFILRIPTFPAIKKTSTPRGGFSVPEYRLLVQTARILASNTNVNKKPTHRNRAGGIYEKTNSIPREIVWLIGFMVNSFVRPSDIIHVKHQHVEIIRGEYIYLRLTLPETKRHKAQIVTLQPAVRIYEKLVAYMKLQDTASQDDYLFLPRIRRREAAGPIISQHFNKILEVAHLRTGQLGQARSLYSLRHTAIMFRLLYGRGIDLLTLARNARTSVQMIEKFYASNLTAEMNIGLLQSRRGKSKN
jgi:site-specific recombinase XerD